MVAEILNEYLLLKRDYVICFVVTLRFTFRVALPRTIHTADYVIYSK